MKTQKNKNPGLNKIKKFTLCWGGRTNGEELDIFRREVCRGNFANIPKEFTLGIDDVETFLSQDIIDKLYETPHYTSYYLFGRAGQVLSLHLWCEDLIKVCETSINDSKKTFTHYQNKSKKSKLELKNLINQYNKAQSKKANTQ